MDSIIKVKNLCFSYDDSEFIKNMSFEIKRNSYTWQKRRAYEC